MNSNDAVVHSRVKIQYAGRMQKKLYILSGTVVRGNGYGQKLGFPTANLSSSEYARKKFDVPFGVYAGSAEIVSTEECFKAGIVIGPAGKDGLPKIEAHLLGFSSDLYGQELRLSFSHYLRPFEQFTNEESLKKQIERDLTQVRQSVSIQNGAGSNTSDEGIIVQKIASRRRPQPPAR